MKDLQVEAAQLQTLEEVLRWARSREPRIIPVETIPQDEYTHDVIFRAHALLFLAFDAS